MPAQQQAFGNAFPATPTFSVAASPVNSQDFQSERNDNIEAPGLYLDVVVDVTDVTGGGSIIVTIQGKDPASGKYYTVLASASLAAVATTVLRVGPALTVGATAANFALPQFWRVSVVASTATVTGTIGFQVR